MHQCSEAFCVLSRRRAIERIQGSLVDACLVDACACWGGAWNHLHLHPCMAWGSCMQATASPSLCVAWLLAHRLIYMRRWRWQRRLWTAMRRASLCTAFRSDRRGDGQSRCHSPPASSIYCARMALAMCCGQHGVRTACAELLGAHGAHLDAHVCRSCMGLFLSPSRPA